MHFMHAQNVKCHKIIIVYTKADLISKRRHTQGVGHGDDDVAFGIVMFCRFGVANVFNYLHRISVDGFANKLGVTVSA